MALKSIAQAADIDIPVAISALFDKPICHDLVVDKRNIEEEVIRFIS